MRIQNPVRRLALLTLASAAAAQTAVPPKPPVPAPGADQPVQLEVFTVTGSNIRRTDAETALPVSVIEPFTVTPRPT